MPLVERMTKPNWNVWQLLRVIERPVILYGTGDGADKVLDELERLSVPVKGIMASDDFVRGQTFRGYRVQRLSDLEQQYPNPVIVIAFGTQRHEVMAHILAL